MASKPTSPGQPDAGQRVGLILGKFHPPHRGHVLLADFARHYVDRLIILVCSIQSEAIPGRYRFAWMRELFPDCDVIHVTDEVPQEPGEHPDFWQIWRTLILRTCPARPTHVFTSEDYGPRLAAELDAMHIPVDPTRSIAPWSGRDVSRNPIGNWEALPDCVRPWFAKRICIFGPESTGKSTLARELAAHFKSTFVPEHARALLDPKNGVCEESDIDAIARGQIAAEAAAARQANRVLICDTDVLSTVVWSRLLFQRCPRWIEEAAQRRTYDLYLLLDVDVLWVDDQQRYFPDDTDRSRVFRLFKQALDERQRGYIQVRGTWQERFARSVDAIQHVLAEPCPLSPQPRYGEWT